MPKKGERTECTILEKAVVSNLTDPASPTFGNISSSGLKAGLAHRARAFEMLKRPRVKLEIEKALILHHVTVPDRVAAISSIIHDSHVTEEIHKIDRKGNPKLVAKSIKSNDKARLRAIDILNKMDSTYHKANGITSLQLRALSPLVQEYSRKLRAALASDAPVASVEGAGSDSTGGDGEITHKESGTESTGPEQAQGEGAAEGSTAEPSESIRKDTS